MSEKTLLIVGGILAAGLILVLYSKNQSVQTLAQTQQINASLQSQALAEQAALKNTNAGQISTVLSSVGGFLNSGALGNLFSSFGATTPGNNDPGLEDASYDPTANDPGLEYGLVY